MRFDIAMRKVEIMTLLNPLHDITDNLPDFALREVRFLLDISFIYEIRQVVITQFHQNAVFVELDVHLIPPVVHSDHEW